MKKILTLLTTFLLVLSFSLGGCSCVTSIPLAFNNDFNGGGANSENNLSNTYVEVLTYDVCLDANYNDTLIRDSLIPESLAPNYTGTYVSTFKGDGNKLPDGVTTDINVSAGDFHYLKTQLDLLVQVDGKTFNDVVISEVYFYSSGYSFAPVYAKTVQKNTFLSIDVEQPKVLTSQNIYEYTTVYNTNSYSLSRRFYDVPSDTDVNGVDVTNLDQTKMSALEPTQTFNYTMKEVIDTTQLLFAIRGLGVVKDKPYYLPTIAPTYGTSKTLIVASEGESVLDVNFNATIDGVKVKKLDGTDAPSTFKMPVKDLYYCLSGSENVGKRQYVKLQKAKTDDFNCFRSLPVEYAESLFEYGNFLSLGALKYSLRSMEVTL